MRYLAVSGVVGYVLGYITMIAALPLIGPSLVLLILTSQTVMSFFAGTVLAVSGTVLLILY